MCILLLTLIFISGSSFFATLIIPQLNNKIQIKQIPHFACACPKYKHLQCKSLQRLMLVVIRHIITNTLNMTWRFIIVELINIWEQYVKMLLIYLLSFL